MSQILKFIKRRKLTCFAFGVLAGCLMGIRLGFSPAVWFALALPPSLIFVFLLIAKKRSAALLFVACVFLFAGYASYKDARPADLPTGKYDIVGRVCDHAIFQPNYPRAVMTLDNVTVGGNALDSKMRVYVYNAPDASAFAHGKTVLVRAASVTEPSGRTNPHGFDYAAYLWKDGIALCASASFSSVETVSDSKTLARIAYDFSDSLSRRIDELYKHNPDIIKALLLGDRSELSEDTLADFKSAGIAHLIALSGLHVGCVALLLEFLLCLALIPRRVSYIITAIFLVFYAIMTGMSASIVRAVIMYAALCAARECGYSADVLARLSIAFILQVSLNPLVITDAAFQLSYTAVFSISAISDLIPRRRRGGALAKISNELRSSLSSTVSAQAGTLPLIATLYHGVPIYSILVNALCIPLGMATVYVSALSLGVSYISTRAGGALALIADGVWSAIRALCGAIASLPLAVYNLRAWSFTEGLCFYAALFLISAFINFRKRFRQWGAVALTILALCICVLPQIAPDGLRIIFLDIGNGDGAVVNARGSAYVIDCGRANGICADYLLSSGTNVRGVFISHCDADHSGGLSEVLEIHSDATVYLPECWNDMDVSEALQKTVAGAKTVYLSAGDLIELDYDIYAEVLWPLSGFVPSDDNDGSLVLRIVYKDASALFMGDLPEPFDNLITADCDLLKVSHHGSKYATSVEFLETATPEISIISVSNNSYGHPSDEVLQRLSKSIILRTDTEGAIIVDMMPNGELIYETANGTRG